jgi:hypothetical protein
MSKRQDPFQGPEEDAKVPKPPDIYEGLRVAEPRKRDRRWEKGHQNQKVVYRGVDPKLPLRVKEIAGQLEVPEGEVARFLLDYALRAYESGALDLIPHPDPERMRMTLFPDPGSTWRGEPSRTSRKTKRQKSRRGSWRVITTWRNFSPELKSEISDLASAAGLDVPVGELVTALLRFSLRAYDQGILELEPVELISGYRLEERGNL